MEQKHHGMSSAIPISTFAVARGVVEEYLGEKIDEDSKVHYVRSTAPGTGMFLVSFKLPHSFLHHKTRSTDSDAECCDAQPKRLKLEHSNSM